MHHKVTLDPRLAEYVGNNTNAADLASIADTLAGWSVQLRAYAGALREAAEEHARLVRLKLMEPPSLDKN